MAEAAPREPRSFKEWFLCGRDRLAAAGVREPDADARILLEYAANINRNYYYLHMHDPMEASDAELYGYLLGRRAEREPVQYLTGEAAFYGNCFYVTPDVLIPRQDTEILVEEAEKHLQNGMTLLDLCTGSGCVLLSLLQGRRITGIGADLSPAALVVAEQNRRRMGLRASWIESDLFSRIGGQFDIIVSNPPYIAAEVIPGLDPEVRDHEPYMALNGGPDGLVLIRRIIAEAREHLRPEAWLLLEIGYDQGTAVQAILRQEGYRHIQVCPDLEGRDRVAVGQR